jgi:hypothetical protein
LAALLILITKFVHIARWSQQLLYFRIWISIEMISFLI